MACEKVLIDYELLARYKEYEMKYHTVKKEIDNLRKKNEEIQKKYDESKSVQKGEGHSAELQQRLITEANGVLNADTQKILPMDNVVDPTEKIQSNSEIIEGVGNNDDDDDEINPWYFLGVPKHCKK